jgi:capsular exopolysaccharide synthesis family protein
MAFNLVDGNTEECGFFAALARFGRNNYVNLNSMQHLSNQSMPQGNSAYPAMNTPQAGHGSLLGVMWRRKGILFFFLACGLGVGGWYFTQEPETYSSTALVEVYRESAPTSTGSAVEEVTELAPTVVFIDAEVKSDAVLRSAAEIGQLSSFPGMPSDPNAIVGALRVGLKISPPFETGSESKERSLVLISFESNNPTLCTAAVNSVVQAYEEYVNGRHRKSIDAVVGFFKEAKTSILPQLNELEAEYTDFRGTAPLEWTANGEAINPFRTDVLKMEESIDELAAESRKLDNKLKLIEESSKAQTSAIVLLKEVQYLLDDVSDVSALEDALVEGTDAEIEIQQKLVPLLIQRDLYSSQLGESHPAVISLDQQIKGTRKALDDLNRSKEQLSTNSDLDVRREEAAKALLRSYVNGLKKKKKLVDDEAADLESRIGDLRERALKLVAFENENASYMRRIDRYQDMLESFDSQLEKASLPLLNPGLQVNVLRPAGMGVQIGPQLARDLLLGGFMGLAVGGLLGWLVDWSERTFRNPDEIAATLDLPILAHLPLIMAVKNKGKGAEDAGSLSTIDSTVSVVHNPHSPGSEAIRQIRTSLFSTATKEAEYQVIQITSALPGDGKSTVVANLASSVAKANKRVLVIDADLRRPTQHTIFGVESELGLTSVLNGECEAAAAICSTAVEGLYLMPTGPKPNNPAEALMLPEFGQTIDDLRGDYDVIIVDTPPLLAVTDASNVANHVDGVMFVMRIGRNVKPMSKRATTLLRALHVNIIGVIVNAIGDSGYSATYANAWSNSYGGQPGSEYGYAYYRYGSDRYLNASKGQTVTVKGRTDTSKHKVLATAATPSSNGKEEV